METTTVTEAKAKLSELLRKVSAGKSILILSRGRPVARLSPVSPAAAGPDSRMARLEEAGVLRRGDGVSLAELGKSPGAPVAREDSLLQALLDERKEAR